MKKAIGIIELPNCADAVQALDIMLKTADVQFLTWEKKLDEIGRASCRERV